jgi:hypothetical protein
VPTSFSKPSVILSPSVVSKITAGEGVNMYAVLSPIANIIAINTVAIIALFMIPSKIEGNFFVPN